MLRIVVAAFGLLALLCVTFDQQLFVGPTPAVRVPVQQVQPEFEMRPVQEPLVVPTVKNTFDAGMLGWGLLGFTGVVAVLALVGEDRAKAQWLANQEAGYSPQGNRSPGRGSLKSFAGRVVPVRDATIRQTAADIGGPEWIPNAAGTEWVRNAFGGRAVNPSDGLVLGGNAAPPTPFRGAVTSVRGTGAVRQTVYDLDGPEYVPNAAGTEYVRNDFGSRAVNPSTGLGAAVGAPSSYRRPRSTSPTGAIRQTVADIGGSEYVPNAAGTEWVRNDFGGRAVNPSTGLGAAAGAPSSYRPPRPASPTGAVRQTVYDLDGPEYVANAAGTEYVRNDFGSRAVNPSTGLGAAVGSPSSYPRPRPASPTGAVRQTAYDLDGPQYVPNAAGTEYVRNDFGSRAVNPSTGLGAAVGSPSSYRPPRSATPTGAIRQTVQDVDQPEYVPNASGTEYVRNDFGGRAVNPSTGLHIDQPPQPGARIRSYERPSPRRGTLRQTYADVGGPEFVPNAAGTEMVRNSFGGRAVNPSDGLYDRY